MSGLYAEEFCGIKRAESSLDECVIATLLVAWAANNKAAFAPMWNALSQRTFALFDRHRRALQEIAASLERRGNRKSYPKHLAAPLMQIANARSA